MKCTHHYCRCIRAAELASMAEHRNDDRLLIDAIAAHQQEVECRMVSDGDYIADRVAARDDEPPGPFE